MKQSLRAFTLIELLVVIAIIAIIAAFLFPALRPSTSDIVHGVDSTAVATTSRAPSWVAGAIVAVALGVAVGYEVLKHMTFQAISDRIKGWGWRWRRKLRLYIWDDGVWTPLHLAEVYLGPCVVAVSDHDGRALFEEAPGELAVRSAGFWMFIKNTRASVLNLRQPLGDAEKVYCVYPKDRLQYLKWVERKVPPAA